MNRLYELRCGVQHYPWGGRRHCGQPPFIAALLNETGSDERPFAELWIGAHARLPARLADMPGNEPLDALIARYPAETLGRPLVDRGVRELPFLLKVLNCEMPLSIQAHPDRARAARLHAADPEHYPDTNHKPELAVAVTNFAMLCQFRPHAAVRADVKRLKTLGALLESSADVAECADSDWLRSAYRQVMTASETDTAKLLATLREEIAASAARTGQDECFLQLLGHFPSDRGALSAYFLNRVDLAPGDAVFLGAGEPHAYLSGTIIECMANSDNVVRAGLTAKFIDRDVLLEMLSYNEGAPEVRRGEETAPGELLFRVPAPEFQLEISRHEPGFSRTCRSDGLISLLLVMNGGVELRATPGEVVRASRGTTWLWPAALAEIEITFTEPGTELVRARPNPDSL